MSSLIRKYSTKILGIGSLLTLTGGLLTALGSGQLGDINWTETWLAASTALGSLGVAFSRSNKASSKEVGAGPKV